MTSKKPSTSPALISGEIVVQNLPSSDTLRHAVATGQRLFIEQPAQELDIVNRVATASSVADVFGGATLTSVKDILGTSIKVLEIESIRPSDFADNGGLGCYLVIRAVDPDGQVISVSVGSVDGMIKLLRLHELGAFPRWVAFDKAQRPTRSGHYPINLVDRQLQMEG